MNEGIHLDTWIVPGQIHNANLCQVLGNRYTPAGTKVLISAVAHNTPPPIQAAQNATTVNTRSSVAPREALQYLIQKGGGGLAKNIAPRGHEAEAPDTHDAMTP